MPGVGNRPIISTQKQIIRGRGGMDCFGDQWTSSGTKQSRKTINNCLVSGCPPAACDGSGQWLTTSLWDIGGWVAELQWKTIDAPRRENNPSIHRVLLLIEPTTRPPLKPHLPYIRGVWFRLAAPTVFAEAAIIGVMIASSARAVRKTLMLLERETGSGLFWRSRLTVLGNVRIYFRAKSRTDGVIPRIDTSLQAVW